MKFCNLIFLDYNILHSEGFNDKEISAIILNEMGKVIFQVQNPKTIELYADGYVDEKHPYFRDDLISSLKKFIGNKPAYIPNCILIDFKVRIANLSINVEVLNKKNFEKKFVTNKTRTEIYNKFLEELNIIKQLAIRSAPILATGVHQRSTNIDVLIFRCKKRFSIF